MNVLKFKNKDVARAMAMDLAVELAVTDNGSGKGYWPMALQWLAVVTAMAVALAVAGTDSGNELNGSDNGFGVTYPKFTIRPSSSRRSTAKVFRKFAVARLNTVHSDLSQQQGQYNLICSLESKTQGSFVVGVEPALPD